MLATLCLATIWGSAPDGISRSMPIDYSSADPLVDARDALGRGDLRFKAFLPGSPDEPVSIPGIEVDPDDTVHRAVELLNMGSGPCDYVCEKAQAVAAVYAKHFNLALDKALEARWLDTAARSMAGWESVAGSYEIVERARGFRNGSLDSYHAHLRSKTKRPVMDLDWNVPLVGGRPDGSWTTLLGLARELDTLVAGLSWLQDWLREDTSRSLEAVVQGNHPRSRSDSARLILPAWKKSGFARGPRYEIHLTQAGRQEGVVHISADRRDALLTALWIGQDDPPEDRDAGTPGPPPRGPGGHWLDGIPAFSYDPGSKNPKFAWAARDGKWHASWTMPEAKSVPGGKP